jgi:hypothetical protein
LCYQTFGSLVVTLWLTSGWSVYALHLPYGVWSRQAFCLTYLHPEHEIDTFLRNVGGIYRNTRSCNAEAPTSYFPSIIYLRVIKHKTFSTAGVGKKILFFWAQAEQQHIHFRRL